MSGPRRPYLPSRTEIYVRFADVDMMQVVHHASYIHWFEQIRFVFLDRIMGLDYEALADSGLSFPLVSCDARFRRSFVFGDEPRGYCRIQSYKKAMFTMHYMIYRGDELGVTGSTTHCYFGPDDRMLLRTPAVIQSAYERAVAVDPDCAVHEARDGGSAEGRGDG